MRELLDLVSRLRGRTSLRLFTWVTRVLLAAAFLPSGLTKVLGHRFTSLPTTTSIGFFFEALYRTGFYWRFIGGAQLVAAALLLLPRTSAIGALLYLSIVSNIFVITVSMHFQGTPFITGLMLLGSVYLVLWDADRIAPILSPSPSPRPEAACTSALPPHSARKVGR